MGIKFVHLGLRNDRVGVDEAPMITDNTRAKTTASQSAPVTTKVTGLSKNKYKPR